jgi:hypothetical protein
VLSLAILYDGTTQNIKSVDFDFFNSILKSIQQSFIRFRNICVSKCVVGLIILPTTSFILHLVKGEVACMTERGFDGEKEALLEDYRRVSSKIELPLEVRDLRRCIHLLPNGMLFCACQP